jgi:N-acetylglucosamine malate deacetylase 1
MNQQLKDLRVIMIGAHPDDCELKSGGTAALWAEQGARVMFLSLTCGDAGHQDMGGGPLARRRRQESIRSAEVLGVSSATLDVHDGELYPTLEVRKAVIRAIRTWKADIVISCRPNDYHPDHRYSSQVVQDAAYLVMVPNVCPDTPPLKKNPAFMYFFDGFRKPCPFSHDVTVDVDRVMEKKYRALDTMDSQMYEWLPWVEGKFDQVPQSKKERFKWLPVFLEAFLESAGAGRESLAARYGKEHADKVKSCESFELCEYGSQPSRAELWEMFPR